jgi:AraC family transcriptional regulator
MTSGSSAGELFSKNFRTDEPDPPMVAGLKNGPFAAARIVYSGIGHGMLQVPPQEAFVLAYLRKEFSNSELWVGERPTKWDPIQPGQVHFYDLERGIRADIREPLDFIYLYLPRQALNDFTDEHELPRVDGCSIDSGKAFSDQVVAGLASSIMGWLERPAEASQLLVDQIAFTLQSRFVYHYARLAGRRAFRRGGLTPRQEHTAKELMRAHIVGAISVEKLAEECGVSRGHFFRAFRWTTGKTPHQWLIEARVELSKELLLTSRLSLSQIAAACGFANPSHFTRVFSSTIGTAPRAWRAARLD